MSKATKGYKNVRQMMNDLVGDDEVRESIEQRIGSRQIIKNLLALRAAQDRSQKDIAKHLGCTQSRVSKLESGVDDDLRLGDFHAYLAALGLDLTLVVTDAREDSVVRQVKFHAFRIKNLLNQLADLAKDDETIIDGVTKFFGESAFNLMKILAGRVKKLPRNGNGQGPYMKIEVISDLISEDIVNRSQSAERKSQHASNRRHETALR